MVWRTQKRPSQEIIHASSQNTRWVANPSEPFLVSTKIATAPTTMSAAMAQYVHAHLMLLGSLACLMPRCYCSATVTTTQTMKMNMTVADQPWALSKNHSRSFANIQRPATQSAEAAAIGPQ